MIKYKKSILIAIALAFGLFLYVYYSLLHAPRNLIVDNIDYIGNNTPMKITVNKFMNRPIYRLFEDGELGLHRCNYSLELSVVICETSTNTLTNVAFLNGKMALMKYCVYGDDLSTEYIHKVINFKERSQSDQNQFDIKIAHTARSDKYEIGSYTVFVMKENIDYDYQIDNCLTLIK